MLEIRLFGTFSIKSGKKTLPLSSRPAQSLLAYLMLNAGTSFRREKLAGQLWPDSGEERARDYLRHALWKIRKELATVAAARYLRSDDLTVTFDASDEYWLDTAVLARAREKKSPAELMAAVSAYTGDLLPGFYDEWVVLEREHLRAIFDSVMGRLLDLLQEASRWPEVLEWGEKWIAFGERPEPAYRGLMRAHAAQGDMSKLADAYERCRKTLHDFGVDISEQTQSLYEDLKSQAKPPPARKLPAAVLPVRAPESNIPTPLTRLIGRDRELRDVLKLLAGARLLTLTGSGGVGKTRLALQVAAEALATFRDGVWFVDLAPLSDEALVPSTIASILGVREEPTRPLMATLLDSLRNKEVLLILDNCEHLLEVCSRLADAVLHVSRDSRVLATSREALGITGESSYRVPSLECPSLARANQLTSEQLEHFPAVQLFTERATQAVSTFTVTNANAPTIAQICDRLDGIPLAIELAAARVKSLSLEQIASRLDDHLGLLTGGSRTALPRQQTLRATLDWSHSLLSETERLLFRRLSAFRGGWTLEEAEQICAGNGIQSPEVSDVLTHLVGKSLVTWGDHAGGSRYGMLETIRQSAGERLLEANESEPVRDQHLQFFVKLAEDSRPVLESARRVERLPRLELEHDNLRAALEWACQRDLETARWLAGMLERFWFYADHLSEARTWYERVLAAEQPTELKRGLGLALVSSGCVLLNLGYLDEAGVRLEQSVAAWQQLGEPTWLAFSLAWLAYSLLQRGDREGTCAICAKHESLLRDALNGLTLAWVLDNWGTSRTALRRDDPAGKALLDEALTLARTLQDPFCYLLCYSSLGDWAVLQGDYAAARRYYLDSLEWRRRLGTRWIIASGLWQVANIMRLQADYLQAEPVYAEALVLSRALADERSEAHIGQELGAVAIHLGDAQRATDLLSKSLSAFRKWEDALGIARCLLGFADLQLGRGDAEQAVRVLSFIDPWLQSNKMRLVHFDRSNYERSLEAARTQIGASTFAAAQAAGTRMTLEEVIAAVLRPT